MFKFKPIASVGIFVVLLLVAHFASAVLIAPYQINWTQDIDDNVTINGTLTVDNGSIDFNDLLVVDNLKSLGTTYSVGAMSTDALFKAGNIKSNATLYAVGAVSTDALLKAANIKSNATIYATTTLNSGGTATVNAITVNTTAAFTRPPALAVNASTTLNTTVTSTADKSFYTIDASGHNITLTLPDAGLTTGRTYRVKAIVDPGTYYARINATGTDHLETNHYLVTTDQYSAMALYSDGTQYWKIDELGTWAAHA